MKDDAKSNAVVIDVDDSAAADRRTALKSIGKFATHTAPAMMVLLAADNVLANDKGKGKGGGGGGSIIPKDPKGPKNPGGGSSGGSGGGKGSSGGTTPGGGGKKP